jgi:hypothetical protein
MLGQGLYPKYLKMAGIEAITGSVLPFSQFTTVQEFTPISIAASLCIWPN